MDDLVEEHLENLIQQLTEAKEGLLELGLEAYLGNGWQEVVSDGLVSLTAFTKENEDLYFCDDTLILRLGSIDVTEEGVEMEYSVYPHKGEEGYE